MDPRKRVFPFRVGQTAIGISAPGQADGRRVVHGRIATAIRGVARRSAIDRHSGTRHAARRNRRRHDLVRPERRMAAVVPLLAGAPDRAQPRWAAPRTAGVVDLGVRFAAPRSHLARTVPGVPPRCARHARAMPDGCPMLAIGRTRYGRVLQPRPRTLVRYRRLVPCERKIFVVDVPVHQIPGNIGHSRVADIGAAHRRSALARAAHALVCRCERPALRSYPASIGIQPRRLPADRLAGIPLPDRLARPQRRSVRLHSSRAARSSRRHVAIVHDRGHVSRVAPVALPV